MKAPLFTCVPTKARPSVERHGIDPARSQHGRWNPSDSGFYAFTELDEAKWYASVQAHEEPVEPFDLWEVEPAVEPRFDNTLVPSAAGPIETSAVYHDQPAPKARLLATYTPGRGWEPQLPRESESEAGAGSGSLPSRRLRAV